MLAEEETRRIAALAARRLAHEPVARIRGRKEFWSLDLRVTPDVLVPRPETETVVEAALDAIGPQRRTDELRIADLGTGSGALLIALLHELPRATGVATDRSIAALEVARENALAHGVASRAAFVACDYGAALGGGFDLVVTNPPYIRAQDIAETCAGSARLTTRDWRSTAGRDGLDAYRAIAADAPRLLRRGWVNCCRMRLWAGRCGRHAVCQCRTVAYRSRHGPICRAFRVHWLLSVTT